MYEFLMYLREAILEFYVGLIQGLLECNQLSRIQDRLSKVIDYADICLRPDYHPNENIYKSVLGVVGDICRSN
jgi:hypothetical protein